VKELALKISEAWCLSVLFGCFQDVRTMQQGEKHHLLLGIARKPITATALQ
jgi:hypothetical protein